MLLVCWLLFEGALEQTQINWDVSAPSSGVSMAWFYAVGVVFGVSAAVDPAERPLQAASAAARPRPT